MNKHTADDFELTETRADIMRRIGVLSDVALVAGKLWTGCPGDDKSLPALIRYHHGTVNRMASVERRCGVQDYILRRTQTSDDHSKMVQRGVFLQQCAEDEIEVERAKLKVLIR